MREQISVIVPVYNCENYIIQCIESILVQTYSDIELILVDDGSTDNSGKICDSYARNYKNVISLHQNNRGITRARLTGVEAAHGTRITFVDADDWIKADFYETLCKEADGCDVVVSGITRYYEEARCVECKTYYKAGIYSKGEITAQIIPTMMWCPQIETWALDPSLCTKLFKRELIIKELRKAEEVKSDYGEDSMVIFPMILKVEKLKIVEEAFYYHRQRPQNILPDYIKDENFLEKLHMIYRYLKKEFQSAECWDVMQKQLEMFYVDSMEYRRKLYGYIRYDSFVSLFPFNEIRRGSKIVIYGAGDVGKNFIKQNEEYQFCNVIAWVDQKSEQFSIGKNTVEKVETILNRDFDYIIVAVDRYSMAEEIIKNLLQWGISRKKIIWQSIRKCQARMLD